MAYNLAIEALNRVDAALKEELHMSKNDLKRAGLHRAIHIVADISDDYRHLPGDAA